MPGAVIVRSDVERKTLFGAGETEKLPAAAYAPDVTARVYAAIADKARRIVAAGHSAIVDAVFATPQERDALAAVAKAAKVPAAGPVSHRRSGDPNRPRRRTRDGCLRRRRRGGAGPGKLRAGRARMVENRRFRHHCGNLGPRQGCAFRITAIRVIARLTRPRRSRHKRPDAPPSGPGAATKDFP